MISKRAKKLFKETPPIVKGHFTCAEDPFEKSKNPGGYINMGTAENYLMDAEIHKKFKEINSKNEFNFHYDYPQGSLEVRSAYSDFLDRFLNIKKMPIQNISIASGASAILEMLSYTLCNDGDEILLLAPLYNGFYHDLEVRFNCKIKLVSCFDGDTYNHNKFEKALEENNIKLILINNPHNPTGKCLTSREITDIIKTAKLNNLEIIADEIYANSVYGDGDFISFLDPMFDQYEYQNSIHHIYGMAKDFCCSGLKVGMYCGHNKDVAHAMASLSYFHTVSTQTQMFVREILKDKSWCEDFFKSNRLKLKVTADNLTEYFEDNCIPTFPGKSGIFLWIDLSEKFKITSNEDELQVYKRFLTDQKINLSPGQFFGAHKPGIFRVCFAKSDETVNEFIKRFSKP